MTEGNVFTHNTAGILIKCEEIKKFSDDHMVHWYNCCKEGESASMRERN